MALALLVAAVIGTPAGVLVNAGVSSGAFGALLGLCVAAIGVLVLLRERRGDAPVAVAVAGLGDRALPARVPEDCSERGRRRFQLHRRRERHPHTV
jgi:uncharacterized membrane protein YfcA